MTRHCFLPNNLKNETYWFLRNMPRVLIVAYGNPLRCDDGVAWRAADALEAKFPRTEVEIVRLHQLAPEVAETAGQFPSIIFIDAASPEEEQIEPGRIQVEEILPENNSRSDASRFSHGLSPQTVIALATKLYDAHLQSYLVTVKGDNFEHGDSLSPVVSAALPSLISRIETLVQALLSSDSPPAHPDKP